MEIINAVGCLSALAHEGRLRAFRLLVQAGVMGLPAGEIARRLQMLPNSLSANLNVLSHAGLVHARRQGRSIIYTADYDRMGSLLGFLVADCCGGSPEICGPLTDALQAAACDGACAPESQGDDPMTEPTQRSYSVLFLCTGNSARSIMAEAIMNRLGGGRFKAFSAGSHPSGQINPHALALLKRMHHPTEALRSKPWDEFSRPSNPDAPELDFVFTVCDNAAGEICPIWPGQPMSAHWGLPDPAAFEGGEAETAVVFADTYRMLSNRIGLFVNLPLTSLDKLSLQRRLDAIGKTADEPARNS